MQYWLNLPYVGLGPGAHGFAGGVRYSVLLSPQKYIRALREVHDPFVFPYSPATDTATVVDRSAEISETLIMGLRLTQRGIERPEFRKRFGIDLLDLHGGTIRRYADVGLLNVSDERVRLTEQGRLLSNMIFRELV